MAVKMRRAFAFLLLLAGCAPSGPGMRPGTDYHVRTPEQIATLACKLKIHDCRQVYGFTLLGIKPCQVYVQPLTTATAYEWLHEERHCDEGAWHETKLDN